MKDTAKNNLMHWVRIRQLLGQRTVQALIGIYSDDAYIASYPRSGNTWMRTMLTYLIQPESISSLQTLKVFIPGISFGNLPYIYRLSRPRLLKTHSLYQAVMPKALYILRDGRDVLISYYHYNVTRLGRSESFPVFFDKYCQGAYGHLWHENVESWLGYGSKALAKNMFLLKFEDLKANTVSLMSEVVQFFNIPATPDQIKNAVTASSVDEMRKVEQKQRGKLEIPNQSIYRGGRTGQWQEYFSPDIEERFLEISSNALKLAGYSV